MAKIKIATHLLIRMKEVLVPVHNRELGSYGKLSALHIRELPLSDSARKKHSV